MTTPDRTLPYDGPHTGNAVQVWVQWQVTLPTKREGSSDDNP